MGYVEFRYRSSISSSNFYSYFLPIGLGFLSVLAFRYRRMLVMINARKRFQIEVKKVYLLTLQYTAIQE